MAPNRASIIPVKIMALLAQGVLAETSFLGDIFSEPALVRCVVLRLVSNLFEDEPVRKVSRKLLACYLLSTAARTRPGMN